MVQRWKPMQTNIDQQPSIDSILGDAWLPFQSNNLALDIDETNGVYTVRASLPGVGPEDIHVSLHDNVLTIHGEMNTDQTFRDRNCHIVMRERRAGKFSRSVRLQDEIDAQSAEAEYENGVLTLWLPKGETAEKKRISVNIS